MKCLIRGRARYRLVRHVGCEDDLRLRYHDLTMPCVGRPGDPWFEPDVGDHIRTLPDQGVKSLVIAPVGFKSDHMEVLLDLDEEAHAICQGLGLDMARASTVGTHPLFVSMVRELIQERLGMTTERRAIGHFGPSHDVCPTDCCLYTIPTRPVSAL